LEERTYIVVGTLERKWDIEDKFGLNGKNLYVLCCFCPIVFYSFVQLPNLNDVVGGNITIIVLTYSKCWEIVLLGMNCHREDQVDLERETKEF
jgi:hypothetical protein